MADASGDIGAGATNTAPLSSAAYPPKSCFCLHTMWSVQWHACSRCPDGSEDCGAPRLCNWRPLLQKGRPIMMSPQIRRQGTAYASSSTNKIKKVEVQFWYTSKILCSMCHSRIP